MSTVSEQPTRRAQLPTNRGRRTQAAIDAAARTVIARKGILATTIADIAAEAGRSTASFYNYYDSKEAMVREWALRFRDEANQRALTVIRPGLSNRERAQQAAAAHWHTYRNRLAEIVSVSQLAMINDDFAQYWAEICAIPTTFITEMVRRAQAQGYCAGDDPTADRGGDRGDAQPVLLPPTRRSGFEPGRRARRRGLHQHVGEHLLPSYLLQGGPLR